MKKDLFDEFPHIISQDIIIRKMEESDLDDLFEICSSENVYKFTPDFLFTKSKKVLLTTIKNLGQRDFIKKRWIIAGICLKDNPEKVIGTAEMFEYNKDINMVEIGYRINEQYWNKKIATKAVKAMTDYLFNEIGINRIQATVMPENINSAKVLLNNGFIKEGVIRQGTIWKGKGVIDLEMYSLLSSDKKNYN